MGMSPFGNPRIYVEIELDPVEYPVEDMAVFKAQVKRAVERVLPDTVVSVRAGQVFELVDNFSRKVA